MSEDWEAPIDPEKLLTLAKHLAFLRLNACNLLSAALKAEMRFAESDEPLHARIEKNDPARMVDIFDAPTFRRRLRDLRVSCRTLGTGPDCYVIRPDDDRPGVRREPDVDLSRLLESLKELRAIGKALAVVGPEPPRRRKERFEEMYLLKSGDDSAVLDDGGLPVIVPLDEVIRRRAHAQPVWAIERNFEAFRDLLRVARQETKGLRKEGPILEALNRGGRTPPSYRPRLATILAGQRRRFPAMRTDSVALCWAYGVEADPVTAERLRRRKADRTKKRRERGGHIR